MMSPRTRGSATLILLSCMGSQAPAPCTQQSYTAILYLSSNSTSAIAPQALLYFRAYWAAEFEAVNDYLSGVTQKYVDEQDCTRWIRRSSRRLCLGDLITHDGVGFGYSYLKDVSGWTPGPEALRIMSSEGSNHETMVISSLSLSQYHAFCSTYEGNSPTCQSVSAHTSAALGEVIACGPTPPDVASFVNIASLSPGAALDVEFQEWRPKYGDVPSKMDNSWNAYSSFDILRVGSISTEFKIDYDTQDAWFCQANHIFDSLGIQSSYENYVLVDSISVSVTFSNVPHCPEGILMLCPVDDLRTGPYSIQWPKCAAYWSVDPHGFQPLTTEAATRLGFPSIELHMDIRGTSWQTSAYAGLRKFYQGKGFNPNSQDVARHLGEPLYQVAPPKSEPSVDKITKRVKTKLMKRITRAIGRVAAGYLNRFTRKMARRNNYLRL
ncbi:hypothetical protein B0H13DRAFT_51929 [Mycena leptocephala]|nr:hypothetical protein B0H13DRAFT_51929 [Mycena leptocephala]